jgi:hypothetical protein
MPQNREQVRHGIAHRQNTMPTRSPFRSNVVGADYQIHYPWELHFLQKQQLYCELYIRDASYVKRWQTADIILTSALQSFAPPHNTECIFHLYHTTLNGYLLRCFAFIVNDTIALMLYNYN